MKSNFMKRAHHYLLLNILLLSQLLQAQPSFEDGNDVHDVPVTSIDNALTLALLTGVIGSYFYLRIKKQQNKDATPVK